MSKHEPTEPWIAELESQANARLIAAAPELLEALRQALDDMGDGYGVSRQAKELMLAIIAKAEGRANEA